MLEWHLPRVQLSPLKPEIEISRRATKTIKYLLKLCELISEEEEAELLLFSFIYRIVLCKARKEFRFSSCAAGAVRRCDRFCFCLFNITSTSMDINTESDPTESWPGPTTDPPHTRPCLPLLGWYTTLQHYSPVARDEVMSGPGRPDPTQDLPILSAQPSWEFLSQNR